MSEPLRFHARTVSADGRSSPWVDQDGQVVPEPTYEDDLTRGLRYRGEVPAADEIIDLRKSLAEVREERDQAQARLWYAGYRG